MSQSPGFASKYFNQGKERKKESEEANIEHMGYTWGSLSYFLYLCVFKNVCKWKKLKYYIIDHKFWIKYNKIEPYPHI